MAIIMPRAPAQKHVHVQADKREKEKRKDVIKSA